MKRREITLRNIEAGRPESRTSHHSTRLIFGDRMCSGGA
jgi:hypothetical protein